MPNLCTLAERKAPQNNLLPPDLRDIVTPLKHSHHSKATPTPSSETSSCQESDRALESALTTSTSPWWQGPLTWLQPGNIRKWWRSIWRQRSPWVGLVQCRSQQLSHISPFSVIPKKSKPGHWRLIINLSSPADHSVNDGIEKDLCSLSYVHIDQVTDCILLTGKGALLGKVDIKQAYRNIPVHPDDRHLLGMRWKRETLIDKTLPFVLRSAPIIFSAVADALQWIVQQQGVEHLFHYLDDFITIGPPQSSSCQHQLDLLIDTWAN